YFNATLFRAFGVGLRTLVLANIAVLAATVALTQHLLERIAGRLAACAGALVFLVCFAFGQISAPSNFTWVFPYPHEITHGFVLALAALAALDRYARTSRWRWLLVNGALVGLAFLTKPEEFLALAAAELAGVIAYRVPLRAALRVALAALVPPLPARALLATALPAPEAGRGVLGGWPEVFGSEVSSLHFYAVVRGTYDVATSLASMATWSAGELALFGLLAWLACRWRGFGTPVAVALAVVVALTLLVTRVP